MYLTTLQESDIGRSTIKVRGKAYYIHSAIGRVQSIDVGKHVYLVDDVIQVENAAQRDKRLGR